MSKQFQNMDPNAAPSLDDDQTKFRARFERLGTFSLAYDPTLLQASPDSSSTVSRSPLQPVKIRTDWSRPDLDDDDHDRELNSSGMCKFSLGNLDDSMISTDSLQESESAAPDFDNQTSILKGLRLDSAASSPAIVTAPADTEDLRRESGSGLSAILHTSSENESDMELSSTCGAILLDRSEGEVIASSPRLGESALTDSEPISQNDISVPSEGKDSEGLSRGNSLDDDIASIALAMPPCVPSPVIAQRKRDSECSLSSEHFQDRTKLFESESENLVAYSNTSSPIKRSLESKSVEGTPARVLFPERARSVESTPSNTNVLISRNVSVASSFNVEGTPSRRNRAIDQVQSEVPELVVRLNSKHDDWTRRSEALKRISKFTTFHIASTSLAESLQPLLDPLAVQLQDLRSQIVKQACITIGDLAVYLGFQFQPFARRLLPRLLDLLRIAKKVMSSSGDECLRRIISHSHVDAIDIIIGESVANKSPIVRCRCLEYVLLALQTWDAGQLVSYKSSIGSLFTKVCSDSTKDVRTAGKKLFNEFSRIWPDDSRHLFQALDQKLQKGILTDFPDLHNVVSSSDEEFTDANISNIQKTPSRLSLAEIKANLRRESLASAHVTEDVIFVEKSPIPAPASTLTVDPQTMETPRTPTKSFTISSHELRLAMVPPKSPSLSFKFDQSYPSVHPERDRLTLSPIPVEFLEGFPVPAPMRASVPADCRMVLPEPSPLVKHSSRKFTSRIVGTPINGKLDETDNDDESTSSSSSTCPTIDQSFDEADDNGQMSVTSSIAAESIDVLARAAAPLEPLDFDQPDQCREKMLMLESKLQYLRTIATSVFDECESPLRTIEIHHDLTTAALDMATQEHANANVVSNLEAEVHERGLVVQPEIVEARVLTPRRDELKCDSTLQVGDYSFEASKSPKDVLNAVLSSPASEQVFKSPDHTPIPTPSRRASFSRPARVDDDNSTLRSILFVLLSMIMFAILLHGLPDFLRPGSDELVSHSKLQYSHLDPKNEPPPERVRKADIPIRDSGELIFESSIDPEEFAASMDDKTDANNVQDENETPEEDAFAQEMHVPSPYEEEDGAPSVTDISHSAAVLSEFKANRNNDAASQSGPMDVYDKPDSDSVAGVMPNADHLISSDDSADAVDSAEQAQAFKLEIIGSLGFEGNATDVPDQPSSTVSFSPEIHVDQISDDADDEKLADSERTQSEDFPQSGFNLTPKFAYLYSLFVAALCWVTYRLRSAPVHADTVDRDPDFDLTGVTMAPEWDINLDSVLPSGPSPLPHPGGSDFQKWNHIKKDGTTMTLFSPLRRTLRIRRPRRPTQF